MDIGEKSVIIAAKDLLQKAVKDGLGPHFKIVRNKVDEDNEKSKRTGNFVSLLTADGNFDERSARTIKYTADGLYKIDIRGNRKIPIEIKVFGKTEEDTDMILETILSYIPRTWSIGQRKGTIDIKTEHSNDYASNYKDGAMQSCFVLISMEIGKPPEKIPTLPPSTSLNGGLNNE
jgi:hypothetical protein